MTPVPWKYRGKKIESHDDLHPECTDIVYVIKFTNGKYYIGKKCVRGIRRKPPLKGKKRNRRVMTNIPFVKYQGSSEDVKELTPADKNILYQCKSKKAATYLEAMLLFEHDAVLKDEYLNSNISGTFYSNSLEGLIRD